LSGCHGNCLDCYNPELKSFYVGEYIDKEVKLRILHKINLFKSLINNVWIVGGEPLDNNQLELIDLLKFIKINTCTVIWLWSRYDIGRISTNIKQYCDFIKSGEYIPELKTEANIQYGITLATSNQNIYKKGIDY
jgi:anaerobic ribonucleoside-triphosphate reductase activating protein